MDASHVNCLVGTTTYRVNKHDISKAIRSTKDLILDSVIYCIDSPRLLDLVIVLQLVAKML